MVAGWDSNSSRTLRLMSLYTIFEVAGCVASCKFQFARYNSATADSYEGMTRVRVSYTIYGLSSTLRPKTDALEQTLTNIYRGIFPTDVSEDAYRSVIWSLRHEVIGFAKTRGRQYVREALDTGKSRKYSTLAQKYLPSWDYSAPVIGSILDDQILFIRGILEEYSSFSKDELSDHASTVVDKINDFSSNLIAYTSDLRKTGDTIRELLKLSRSITSPKSWANAWLSYRYGDRLAIADTKELLASIAKSLNVRHNVAIGRARIEKVTSSIPFKFLPLTISESRTSTVIASNESDTALMTRIYSLMRWDAWPTLENAWDLVPLSFLVDWILPVSDILHNLDNYVEKAYIRPKTSYVGVKRIATAEPFILDDYRVIALRGVYYARYRYDVLKDIRPFTARDIIPAFSVVHLADTVALGRTFRK